METGYSCSHSGNSYKHEGYSFDLDVSKSVLAFFSQIKHISLRSGNPVLCQCPGTSRPGAQRLYKRNMMSCLANLMSCVVPEWSLAYLIPTCRGDQSSPRGCEETFRFVVSVSEGVWRVSEWVTQCVLLSHSVIQPLLKWRMSPCCSAWTSDVHPDFAN